MFSECICNHGTKRKTHRFLSDLSADIGARKSINRGEGPIGSDAEDGPQPIPPSRAPEGGRTIQISVIGLHQRSQWCGPVGSVERNQRREHPVGCQSKDCSKWHAQHSRRRAIQITICRLNEPGRWIVTVGKIEGDQSRELARWRQFEGESTVEVSPVARRSVEIAIRSLD